MIKKDGVPAFPTDSESSNGMTLRDYFAAAAISGLLGNPEYNCSFEKTAREAYEQADEMLSAREEK